MNFTEELDLIKMKLANLTEARNKDSEEINGLQSMLKEFSNDLHSTKVNQEDLQMKIMKLDNTTNKNSERIEKLEQCNAKLSDNMKLLEERENRRFQGARPKVLETMNSALKDRVLEEGRNAEKLSKGKLSYSDKLSK